MSEAVLKEIRNLLRSLEGGDTTSQLGLLSAIGSNTSETARQLGLLNSTASDIDSRVAAANTSLGLLNSTASDIDSRVATVVTDLATIITQTANLATTFPPPEGTYLVNNPGAGTVVVRAAPNGGTALNVYKLHFGFTCSHTGAIGISVGNGTNSGHFYQLYAPNGAFDYDIDFTACPWQLTAGKELALFVDAGWSAFGQVSALIGP